MSRNNDEGHRLTDDRLDELERRIAQVYSQAAKDMQGKVDAYFAAFAKRDAEHAQMMADGEITEEQYRQWRLAQIGRGKRFEALRDRLAERMTKANETAAAYVNDATPGIYSLNRNYAAYTIEQVADNADFTLWDEQTARRLLTEQPDLMPYYPPELAVKRGIDLAWGKKQITAQVTSGILQGESIKQLADRLQHNIPTMNRNSAICAARTATTGAENAGRQDTYVAAKKMGIKLKKQWLATLDGRTRHAHGVLDGQTVDVDKPFKVDGYELMFPGDKSAPGYLVYNCRCTVVADLDGVDTSGSQRRAVDPETGESVLVKDMTYSEWAAWKQKQNPQAWDIFLKKGKNYSSDQKQFKEYKAILGRKIPNRFADFQNLKYNEPSRWEQLKTEKHQTVFVNNAPCITTPKKFYSYFLRPGTKHSKEFFDVGYTQGDTLRLRYDMARQFDMSKAVDFSVDEQGVESFSIFMPLGITKRKRFRTCWLKDTPASLPRIITAHREDEK